MTSEVLSNAAEFIKDRLYYISLRKAPSKKNFPNCHFFNVDSEFVYWNFFLDFGPLSLAQTYRFCQLLKDKLDDPKLVGKKIYYYSSHHPHRETNAAVLMGAFAITFLGRSAEDAYKPFKKYYPRFTDFHDASPIACTYKLTVEDCLKSISAAKRSGLFRFDETFTVDEVEHMEKVEYGDLNWIIFKQCCAFAGPQTSREAGILDGYSTLMPEDYFEYFAKYKVLTVIRLNKKYYDEHRFDPISTKVIDIYFPDGGVPSLEQVHQFNIVMEAIPEGEACAVHCKAGLGRTGTLIGCYLMKHFGFTHGEAIGWIRICRPGSIIGPQQHFLREIEPLMHKEGDAFRKSGKTIAKNNLEVGKVEITNSQKLSVNTMKSSTSAASQSKSINSPGISSIFGDLDVTPIDIGEAALIHTNKTTTHADLYEDWLSAVDAKSGKTYYYNKFTRESQWNLPIASPKRSASSTDSFKSSSIEKSNVEVARVDGQGDELMRAREKRSPKSKASAKNKERNFKKVKTEPSAIGSECGYFKANLNDTST